MRGKAYFLPRGAGLVRITPAYAGKSIDLQDSLNVMEDHPRLCGEKCLFHSFSFPLQGSPPPMRGKGPLRMPDTLLHRITPAYAGKSTKPTGNMNAVQDHPRLCGEKPPMRGKGINGQWITPAYAGKS